MPILYILLSVYRDHHENETAIDIETPDQKVKHIEKPEPQAFARAR